MSEPLNRETPPSPDALLHCRVCESVVTATDDGRFVCEECGEPVLGGRTRSTPCEQVVVEQGGVTLTKTLEPGTDAHSVQYALSSDRAERVRFRVLDRLSTRGTWTGTELTNGTDHAPPVVDVTWWLPPGGELAFRRDLPADGGETLRAGDVLTIDAVPRLHVDGSDTGERLSVPDFDDGPALNGSHADGDHEAGGATVLAALPAYDEAATIGDVVSVARRVSDAVLVVDDGSDDETRARALAAGAFVVSHDGNRGYGAALQTIFTHADEVGVDHLVVLDGDGQHDPADIPRFVETQLDSGAEIVVGNRFGPTAETEIPLYRRAGLSVVNLLTNLSLGIARSDSRITDTQSGFRAYDSRAVRSLAAGTEIGERMGVSTDILYHARRRDYDVAEVGTTIRYDEEATSSYHPLVHGYMLVANVLRIVRWERPLLALGVPGGLLAVFGLGASVVLVDQFVHSGTFRWLGAFVALAIVLLGVLAIFNGIVLHSLRLFEEHTE